MIYFGICENRNDPLKLGRVQVRVFGLHNENKIKIPTEDLPWAGVLHSGSSLSGIGISASSILEGSMLAIMFIDGESKQIPVVLGSIHGIPQDISPVKTQYSDDIPSTIAKVNFEDEEPIIEEPSPTEDLLDLNKPIDDQPNVPMITQSGYPNKEQLNNIKEKIGKRESSGNYKAENRFGFIGKYQFGAPLLIDLGYVKPGTKNSDLNDNSVWTGKGGVNSKETWLSNKDAQEKAMDESLELRFKRLKRLGVIDDSTPTDVVAGYIATAHLVGEGGAQKIAKGIDSRDANNVSGNEYFDIGFSAISGRKITPDEKIKTTSIQKPLTVPKQKPIDMTTVEGMQSLAAVDLGFRDPNMMYPFLLKEQDTHRLSRRVTKDTLVEQKNKQRTADIRTIGGTFSQPLSPYNGMYPYNSITFTESGHAIELDDTPENERINIFHTSGTFTEIDKFGNAVNKIIGDSYEIIDKNGYIHIKGTARVTVGGDAKIVVEGDAIMEVDGDMKTNVGGNYQLKVGGIYQVHANGKTSIRSNNIIAEDAKAIYLNSGLADAPGVNPRGKQVVDFDPILPESFLGEATFIIDDIPEEYVDVYYENAVKNGTVKKEDLDRGIEQSKNPEKIDDKPPKKKKDSLPSDCKPFEGLDKIPPNIKISKYYTISSLTNSVTFPYSLKDNAGLSENQIACNLKKLAENVLDPIKEKFPTMFVTSAFRSNGGSSQHEKGQAADLQFSGFSKSDYFEAAQWIKDNVGFDKLLLEYKTTGTGNPWIHVSYKDGPSGQVFTYMNDKSVGSGLRKLQ